MTITELIDQLTCKNDQQAYQALLQLIECSRSSAATAEHWLELAALLQRPKSYEKVRGLILLGENSKWLPAASIAQFLPDYLALGQDPKPTVVRQVLAGLTLIATAHPTFQPMITAYLASCDYASYKDTMRPLLERDRQMVYRELAQKTEDANTFEKNDRQE